LGYLSHSNVAECEALHRVGTVIAVNTETRTLDIQIGDTVYEDVTIHYHCQDWWKETSHPHSYTERDQMMTAFAVDDEVLVLCDDEAHPLYVVGFSEDPKACGGMIVLFKDDDMWYWDLITNQGYHVDPSVVLPTEPEIITKWWSCEELEEVEYYTRATPALATIASGGCEDVCGLINFDSGECCDEPEEQGDESDTWYLKPCGGEGILQGNYYPPCSEGYVSTLTVSCVGGCEPGTQEINTPAYQNTQSRTNNQKTECSLGYSWELSLGGLAEKINIGPRESMTGNEAKSIATVQNSWCGPYKSLKFLCDNVNWDDCICLGSETYEGYECDTSPKCTGWIEVPEHLGYGNKWLFSAGGYDAGKQGCVDFLAQAKSATYQTGDSPIDTIITVGEKETTFTGLWSWYLSNQGNTQEGVFRRGWTTECLSCSGCGDGWGDTFQDISFSFTELSYGVAGWRTVVADDGRFAVLIPQLNLTASGQSIDGDASGSIASTTTALLRIVDDDETDFELADAEQGYDLVSVPTSRDDLHIKPDCDANDLPLDITLRAFHWYELYDWILVAFMLKGEFEASLIKKESSIWARDQLTEFKSWVGDNSLEEYTMFLH
jgi:hypothetical protein